MQRTKVPRILFISFNPDFQDFWQIDTDSLLRHYGANTGNNAFVYSTVHGIQGEVTFYRDIKIPPKEWSKHFDVIVFPAANNISMKESMQWLANIVKDANLPVLVLGLGAQFELNEKVEINPGTLDFFEVAKTHEVWIGARGQFTADILAKHGVKNVEVLGCPSNFINPAVNLGELVEKNAQRIPEDPLLCINLEYFRLAAEQVQVLTGALREFGGFCVFQSDDKVFGAVRDRGETDEKTLAWLSKYFLGLNDPHEFRHFAAQYGVTIGFIPAWLELLRRCDLSIGTRFHGNFMAIQAEMPALIMYHDRRTKEFCELMKLPMVAWSDIVDRESLMRAIRDYHFDGAAYDKARPRLAGVFTDLVGKAGLKPAEHISALSAAQGQA